MNFFIFASFILFFGCAPIDAIELKCNFNPRGWHIAATSLYECKVEDTDGLATDSSNRYFDSITGNHLLMKTHEDVRGFYIPKSKLIYFPRGMDNFFSNLEAIAITHTNLKEICSEDIKPYANLKELYLGNNKIQVLEPNLFQFNQNLEGIAIYNNNIVHIDANVFNEFMGKLKLNLNGNNCILGNGWSDIQVTNQIIEQVKSGSCKNDAKFAEFSGRCSTKSTKSQSTQTSLIIDDQIDEKIKAIVVEIIGEITKELKDVKNELAEVKINLGTLTEVFSKCNCKQNTNDVIIAGNIEKRIKFLEIAVGIDSGNNLP